MSSELQRTLSLDKPCVGRIPRTKFSCKNESTCFGRQHAIIYSLQRYLILIEQLQNRVNGGRKGCVTTLEAYGDIPITERTYNMLEITRNIQQRQPMYHSSIQSTACGGLSQSFHHFRRFQTTSPHYLRP